MALPRFSGETPQPSSTSKTTGPKMFLLHHLIEMALPFCLSGYVRSVRADCIRPRARTTRPYYLSSIDLSPSPKLCYRFRQQQLSYFMQALKRDDRPENLNVDSRGKSCEPLRKQARDTFGRETSLIDSADWIAEVSHELRLPIANIKLLIETLLGGALEDHSTATRMLTR